jgi:ribonuclease HI
MSKTLTVFTDGGSKGNPGPASIGVVFYLDKKKILYFNQKIGIATNNDAEYQAMIKALSLIKEKKDRFGQIEKINFYSDSQLMVSQINGLYKVKSGKIKEYIFKIRQLEMEIGIPIVYHLVPREKNKEADKMVNFK